MCVVMPLHLTVGRGRVEWTLKLGSGDAWTGSGFVRYNGNITVVIILLILKVTPLFSTGAIVYSSQNFSNSVDL